MVFADPPPPTAAINSPPPRRQSQPSVAGDAVLSPPACNVVAVTSSSQDEYQSAYLGDSGYMPIFSHQSEGEPSLSPLQSPKEGCTRPVDDIPPALRQTHLDVYFEYASVWCPVLDRATYESSPQFSQSILLKHALALCSNQIQPPLIDQVSSSDHYQRAKELFYCNHERNPLVRIIAVMLFYWYSSEPPNSVSTDNTWWWTGLAIRLAQQMRLHRRLDGAHPLCEGDTPSLRRRIWWTLMVCYPTLPKPFSL